MIADGIYYMVYVRSVTDRRPSIGGCLCLWGMSCNLPLPSFIRRYTMALSTAEKNKRRLAKRPDKSGPFRSAYETNRKIILATQSVCAICGGVVDKTLKSPHPLSPSIDHIIPVALGGHPSDLSNLQLTHRACNRQKGKKIITEKVVKTNNFYQSFDWKND